ncbi:uncharacterized protein BO66DRAFT_81699 [Aspergillus aculeatinus CBS 121060]|uniref:Uncharacterized protein n=1 Tax=Aspergillus aculeatinus CBS 121060 TaxID=1448322 RepID=A0ACD1HA61_9EURO|nr:hypothetical protein BO66DRAFT_81699 [Aspergillus aculeatinus CBS 121060]RAH70463.1 hypothetical protein BO66DRAFT_81699 [Aspergillus aculeatinus CBS 121060]
MVWLSNLQYFRCPSSVPLHLTFIQSQSQAQTKTQSQPQSQPQPQPQSQSVTINQQKPTLSFPFNVGSYLCLQQVACWCCVVLYQRKDY